MDGDHLARRAVADLLETVGINCTHHRSCNEFLAAANADAIDCIVLDVRLPDRSGLELLEQLVREGRLHVPVVFLTGYGDIRTVVRAMKGGAHDFLAKPFNGQELLEVVQSAIARGRAQRKDGEVVAEVRRRFATLTAREKEMMALVAKGNRNKEIATVLNVTDITVKAHRNQVMKKMGARSVAELIGMAQLLRLDGLRPLALVRRRLS
ncbi:MAG: response regulator transcription factor [Alphaproteobacteria bacterium]|nr:response regulator transcription factor [Alphaproteobacteria bacterium]MBL6936845.1 response regulator transcription factor [Alphaproteobacteria bacterium]MBL7097614.1 response regulator transcription factor [Alphaproteobacteria bacterium]